jgi:ABC-type nitrate/sulfonate/bicarbonate transport system substrate-binding protein
MGFVLADQQGWLSSSSSSGSPYLDTVALNTFENLRNAVNSGEADFFMWEHFTSKRYYDSGEIRKVGEIYTPWSSWKIVASTRLDQEDERTKELFEKLDKGVKYFNENQEEAVKYISTELDYSEEDAREWLKTVRFPEHTSGVDVGVIKNTVEVLRKAGVLTQGKGLEPETMVASAR